jgi:hypothetical protein
MYGCEKKLASLHVNCWFALLVNRNSKFIFYSNGIAIYYSNELETDWLNSVFFFLLNPDIDDR